MQIYLSTILLGLLFASTVAFQNKAHAADTTTSKQNQDVNKISDYIHVSVSTSNFWDSSADGFDINLSQIGVVVGKEQLQQILNEYGIESYKKGGTIINFSMKFSILPFLLKESTKDTLFQKVDRTIDAKKDAIFATVKEKVGAALNADPKFITLPASVQAQVKEKTLAGALAQANAQLEAARTMKKDEIAHRINSIELETAIQEVALVLGQVVGDGTAIVYLKVGKFHIENGGPEDYAGMTEIEKLRVMNSRTQHGTTTANTGALNIGMQKIFPNKMQLRADAYFFHDRIPFVSGKDFVASTVSQSQEAFDNHEKWWKIDSAMLRLLLKTDRNDIYVVGGSYNGKGAIGAGYVLRITPQDIITIDLYKGSRDSLGTAASVFYAHTFKNGISAFVGYENIKDSYQPAISTQENGKVSFQEKIFGISWTILEKKLRQNAKLRWILKGELFDVNAFNNSMDESTQGVGFRGGSQIDVNW